MILSSLLRIIFFLACAFTTMPCQEFVQDENNYYLQCDSNNCANYLGSGKWMAYSSFNAQVGHLDDYRWEKLPVHTTSGRYEFPYVRPTPQHSPWNITMSIRGRNDASIVLCEGVNPFNSGCYWIILGGWPNLNRIGETNVIRKCVNGVPIKGFPKDECKTKRDQYKGWSLSEKEWKHASIHWSKSNESAELLVTVQGIQKPILHFVDRQYLDIKYVSFRSMNMELQWRVHEYQFWGTSSNGSSLISREFQPKSKNLCLSFFYSIPTAVGLSSTLTMQASNRAGLLQHLATFQNKQDDTINWKYAQVLTTREYWDHIKIMFTVHMEWEDQSITSDPRQYVFGVDSIRGCDPKGDVRTLKLQSYRSQVTGGDPPSCQLLQKSQLTLKPARPNLNSNSRN
uniref:Farnesoic acid O-methyl transferase domain-containing protein n=1 Tax=Timema cristinae TaxID=61476 RepID=A0A7R9GT02_TIMCR|nr:unnamed protein product [Timema cristinae]